MAAGVASRRVRGLTTAAPHARSQISLMDEGGNTRDDLFLPTGTDDADNLAKLIKSYWADQKEMAVTVLKVRRAAQLLVTNFSLCEAAAVEPSLSIPRLQLRTVDM
jgi:hypothetical protein